MKKILKILKKFQVKKLFILIVLLFIYTTFCAVSYAKSVSADLSNSVFRLHVIANSDTDIDQNLKYKVRDSLLEYMNSISVNCSSKQEAIDLVTKNQDNFKNVALQTIYNEGFSYDVNIEIGNFEFPTKYYGDISLPAGYYDALKVEIGEAKGQNWWCVMFPSLCFVDISSGIVPEDSKQDLKDNLSDEEYSLISDSNNNSMQFKFKILEIFANSGLFTAKND